MTTKVTIVLVEDDELIRENYRDILAEEGYRVRAFSDRESAYQNIILEPPNLAIIDVGLGRERDGGIRLCHQIRLLNETLPIIFLTSYEADSDRIAGMHCEIDDYIIKSESIDYLIVRIATLLQRVETLAGAARPENVVIERGDLKLDRGACIGYWKDQRLNITLTQYWILQELALRPGQIKSPSKLMSAAKIVVEPNTIAANIKSIRRRFKDIDPAFDKIKAEYGVGYRWIE